MKAVYENNELVGIELTRRNLETLLLKLERADSERTITKLFVNDHRTRAIQFAVTAVENEAHYADRPAGEMHPAEEPHLSRPETGVAR